MSAKEGTLEILYLRAGKQVFSPMPIAVDWQCCLNSCGYNFKNESELVGKEQCDQFSDVCQGTGLSLGSLDVKSETGIPVEVIS